MTPQPQAPRSKRALLYPEIARMRDDEGLTWAAIGQRLGLSLKTAHDYYSDPTGEVARGRRRRYDASEKGRAGVRSRTRTEPYRGRCGNCGGLLGVGMKGKASRCRACEFDQRHAGYEQRLDAVERMWNEDGMTGPQISAALGMEHRNAADTYLQELRRRGRLVTRRKATA